MLRPAYLSQKLVQPLPTKDGGTLLVPPGSGMTTTTTCSPMALSSAAFSIPTPAQLARLGCGRWPSATTRTARRRTAMRRAARPRRRRSPKVRGGSRVVVHAPHPKIGVSLCRRGGSVLVSLLLDSAPLIAWPERPPGPAGPAGLSTSIRFVDGECRQPCIVACEDNERILDTIAINPGGTFIFDADNKATFRPEQQDRPVKVILACVRK
jgi:hypothetical protein